MTEEYWSSQVEKRRCSICHSPMILVWDSEDEIMVCGEDRTHEGHVSADWVHRQERQQAKEYDEVIHLYPHLRPEVDREELEANKRALFGE